MCFFLFLLDPIHTRQCEDEHHCCVSLPLQYEVSESSLLSRTLWLSVWDWDRFGRNQFLGEVRVALKEFDLSTYTERWYPLKDKVGDGRGVEGSHLTL